MEEEKKYLKFILDYVNEKLDEQMKSYDDLLMNYRRNPDRFAIAFSLANEAIKIYENGKNKPYFGRIDIKSNDKEEINKLYIGKYGIREESDFYVLDWRSPVCNLYYNSEIGQASYMSPSGEKEVELLLKRQFDIENGILNGYYDVDLISNDSLLQKYLNENNDARLKNIVSTIQKEQNLAIREPLNKNIIVQGVAGSGKTTIALHRIAYLVYNYQNTIKNSQYLVIGPNDVFLKYIKSVLPDLDVDDINQNTYEKFTKEVLEEDFKVKQSSKVQNDYITGKRSNDIPKFKNSLKYKEMLDEYINEYVDSVIDSDLCIKDYIILEKEELKNIFLSILNDNRNFEKTIDRFVLIGSAYIDKMSDKIVAKVNAQNRTKFEESKKNGTTEEVRQEGLYVKEEIKKGCKTYLRKYMSKLKISSIDLYKKFINDIDKYNMYNYKNIKELKKETLENIKNKEFDFEDLATLLYIKSRIGLSDVEQRYRHVVVDEAQDLGEFNFYALKSCLPNATFSIFGDIAQSIYSYRSIESWQEVMDIFDDCELLPFNKSYRTTDEIMSVANAVSETLNIDPAELSVRHGNDVLFTKVDKDDIPIIIKEKIEQYKNDGYKTIAVISKYPLQSNYINDDLSFEGLIIPNIDENTDITKEGNEIVTISNALAKGLEFDVVIINNADEDIYDSNKPGDMKMLYVALTRALHNLDVIYTDKISAPLQKFVEKEKVKTKSIHN